VESLDQAPDVSALVDKANGGTKSNFAYDIVGHEPNMQKFQVNRVNQRLDHCQEQAKTARRPEGKKRMGIYTAHGAKSNFSPVLAKFSDILTIQSLIMASIKGSIFLTLVKLY